MFGRKSEPATQPKAPQLKLYTVRFDGETYHNVTAYDLMPATSTRTNGSPYSPCEHSTTGAAMQLTFIDESVMLIAGKPDIRLVATVTNQPRVILETEED